MITNTNYFIKDEIRSEAKETNLNIDFKHSLNYPTGDFFYDPWTIKEEYRGTVWDELLKTIPSNIGEARLIKLSPGTAYRSHADMDDRYHCTIQGERSFIIYTDKNLIYPQQESNYWQEMDAGSIHSAVNTGRVDRIQLVVRKLLFENLLKDPVAVEITLGEYRHDYRYIFDEIYSPWLNAANKEGKLNKFVYSNHSVTFDLDRLHVDELRAIKSSCFNISFDGVLLNK